MNCNDYRALHGKYTAFPVLREVWDSTEGRAWTRHWTSCSHCANWTLEQELGQRGVRITDYPCIHMANYATVRCDMHEDLFECHKSPIVYDERFDEYAIGPRGGEGDLCVITHCPWCGVALPPSQRDAWFDELERMNVEPFSDDVPVEFRTKAWRENRP